jgi:ComF family protein
MSLNNKLWTALNLIAAYLGLENCRACKKPVNNRNPIKPPQSVCIQCWMKLLKSSAATHMQVVIPNGSMHVYAAGMHSGLLRKLIIKLKQTEDPLLACDLLHLLLKNSEFTSQQLAVATKLIIPMPLHKQRLRSRGFNQSELLAKALSTKLKLPLLPAALKRTRDTRSQRGLHRDQRWANMQGVFVAQSNLVKGKSILLVDDVRTSGATMKCATEALLDAGATSVAGICIATAPLLYEVQEQS